MPTVDLLVIGGGIHGACVARDAALRGLSVTLVEKGDLACGTSSRSSKLVHGGIRYLETGQFGLVREALREREILLRTAPTLVRPVDFVVPFYEGDERPPWFVRAGLTLYDLLAGRGHPHHMTHERDALLSAFPFVPREGLRGGAAFADAQMDDAMLVVANAMDAASAGATIRVGAEVRRLARVEDGLRASFPDGDVIEARVVVNAAGPWVDRVRGRFVNDPLPSLRLTRGTHIVVPALVRDFALLLFAKEDERVFFVLPWGDCSLVGTTDTDDSCEPDAVRPAAEDVRYLWDEIARRWPHRDPAGATMRVFAGLRPLTRSRRDHPWDNSREARLIVEDGVISLVGGKFTTARRLAEQAVDLVVRKLGRRVGPCVTTKRELPRISCQEVLSPEGVACAVDEQFARHVADVVFRRSSLWLDASAARAAAPKVASVMATRLGWNEATREAEIAEVCTQLDAEDRILEEARQ